MNRKLTVILLMWIALLPLSASAQDASDDELLTALDQARFFDSSVTQISIRIVSVTPDETRDAELSLSFQETDQGSSTRIEFTSPPELAGQIYLSTPDATYFFGPDLDFPIKTSATTQVFGDSAVAQTSGIRFADSYTISDRRSITQDDGTQVWEIDLSAVDYSVAFQIVTVTVDPETLRPLSAILYAVSGIPFYQVFYEQYAVRDGSDDVYVKTQRIVNLLLMGRETTSEVLELRTDALPDSFFDPEQLGSAAAP